MACRVKVVVGHFATLSVSPAHPCCIALTKQSTHAGLQNKLVGLAEEQDSAHAENTCTIHAHSAGQISRRTSTSIMGQQVDGKNQKGRIPAGSAAAQMKFVAVGGF